MIYITYDKQNGQILGRADIPDHIIELQTADNILWIDADPLTQYIDLETLQPMPIPEKPNEYYQWDVNEKIWVFDPILAEFLIVQKRNKSLQKSDWTQLPDVPLETKAIWAIYRQALRDIPQQETFPENVIWPTPPE